MKTLITIISILFVQWGYAQGQYEKAMGEALQMWGKGESKQAMAKFERIANVEKDNWIPKYYLALVAATSSFSEQDLNQKRGLIETANKLIPTDTKALNAEWLIVQALNQTAELTIDPMNNAMRLSPIIMENYQKALSLEPNNPRAILGLADFKMQSKKFMGGNTDQECKDLQKALSLFETQKNEIKFYPSWGKERVQQLIQSCKSK